MIMRPPPLKITKEDEELIFAYKNPRKRGRIIFPPEALELAIIRAETSTSLIIKEMTRRNEK